MGIKSSICATPLHYPQVAEVENSMDALLDSVQRLKKAGHSPLIVTVCSSTRGYQPPQYTETTESLAGALSSILDAEGLRTIKCMLCANLNVVNDLSESLDVLYKDQD